MNKTFAYVYAVEIESGAWSDYVSYTDSLWATEADALSHIIQDLGYEFDKDGNRLAWKSPKPRREDYPKGDDGRDEWECETHAWEDERATATIKRYPVRVRVN